MMMKRATPLYSTRSSNSQQYKQSKTIAGASTSPGYPFHPRGFHINRTVAAGSSLTDLWNAEWVPSEHWRSQSIKVIDHWRWHNLTFMKMYQDKSHVMMYFVERGIRLGSGFERSIGAAVVRSAEEEFQRIPPNNCCPKWLTHPSSKLLWGTACVPVVFTSSTEAPSLKLEMSLIRKFSL